MAQFFTASSGRAAERPVRDARAAWPRRVPAVDDEDPFFAFDASEDISILVVWNFSCLKIFRFLAAAVGFRATGARRFRCSALICAKLFTADLSSVTSDTTLLANLDKAWPLYTSDPAH